MEKIQISQVFNCNRVIMKLLQQQAELSISTGLKLLKILKTFDEVEEYVFSLMEITFENFNFDIMTDEQQTFFNKIMDEKIELDYKRIPFSEFENNEKVKLTIDEIEDLSIILTENRQ